MNKLTEYATTIIEDTATRANNLAAFIICLAILMPEKVLSVLIFFNVCLVFLVNVIIIQPVWSYLRKRFSDNSPQGLVSQAEVNFADAKKYLLYTNRELAKAQSALNVRNLSPAI